MEHGTVTMQAPGAVTTERTMPHSVEVTRNAKGDYQWSLKVYFEDGAGDATVETIRALDARLRAEFLP